MKFAHTCSALALPLLLLTAGLANAADLKPYTANYELVRNGDTIGTAVFTLKQTSDGWDLESVSRGTHGAAALASANIDEGSRVATAAGRLEMRDYHYRLSSLFKDKVQTIVANPATRSVTVNDGKRDTAYPLQAGAVDKLSLSLAIALDLAAGKQGVLSYPVAGRDRIDPERYQVGSAQNVTVPAGSQRTIPVTRLADKANGRSMAYWFGVDNGFVPVKVVHTEANGEVEELRLSSLTH